MLVGCTERNWRGPAASFHIVLLATPDFYKKNARDVVKTLSRIEVR